MRRYGIVSREGRIRTTFGIFLMVLFVNFFFFFFWFGEEIIGTEQKEEVLMVICGETPLEGEGHVETP